MISSPKVCTVFLKMILFFFKLFLFSEEVASLTQLFPLLEAAAGTFGMAGLDRLLGLQATSLLQKIVGVMEATIFKDKAWIELLQNLSNSLNPIENIIAQVSLAKKKLELSQAKSNPIGLVDVG